MIFLTVIVALASLGLGFMLGYAKQYNDARERLRVRVIESNLDNLTTERVTKLLNEL